MTAATLQNAFDLAIAKGYQPIAVGASACTTATGSYDPLNEVADFCEAHDLWFHVDGAHGFAVALADDYRHLLSGIERADSIIWDMHKMMLMPALITAVVFKNYRDSYIAFSQKASYLFDDDEDPWYDLAHRTVECTKSTNAIKAYFSLQAFGTDFFAEYVKSRAELTSYFATLIEESSDFELATKPDFNIICFRYCGAATDINEMQLKIRKELIENGKFYVVQTNLNGDWYLRCTVINPLTDKEHLKNLLAEIRSLAQASLK
jgi:L-2,4-diaminobutyrate decarboxylase